MVILDASRMAIDELKNYLAQCDIRILGNRWVLHQDISADDVDTIIDACHHFDRSI